MPDYRRSYSLMTDDQLLDLASQDAAALVPEARSALNVELTNRQLGALDVTKYASDLHIAHLVAEQQKLPSHTLGGFGTRIYGRRRIQPDGSFWTTKWFVCFWWIPLFPLNSFRVKYVAENRLLYSRHYLILAESRPDLRQVISTYLFVSSFFLGAWILDLLHAPRSITYGALALWACTPWSMRWAGRHNSKSASSIGSKDLPFQEQVEMLLQVAPLVAMDSCSLLLTDERFHSQMTTVAKDSESWKFFVTAACFNTALMGLALDNRIDAVGPMVNVKIDEWNPDGLRGVADCGRFVANRLDGIPWKRESSAFQERIRDATGMWVLWNLYGRAPTFEECQLGRAVGFIAVGPFLDWWE